MATGIAVGVAVGMLFGTALANLPIGIALRAAGGWASDRSGRSRVIRIDGPRT